MMKENIVNINNPICNLDIFKQQVLMSKSFNLGINIYIPSTSLVNERNKKHSFAFKLPNSVMLTVFVTKKVACV